MTDFEQIVGRFAAWFQVEERAWMEERQSRWNVAALESLAPRRRGEEYAFVRLPDGWDTIGLDPIVAVEDGEELTLIIPAAQARSRGWPIELLAACIEIADVTGFGAAGPATIIAARLTAYEIPHRIVAGLECLLVFMPVDRVEDAFDSLPRP